MADIGGLIARAVTDPASAPEVATAVGDLVARFPAYDHATAGV